MMMDQRVLQAATEATQAHAMKTTWNNSCSYAIQQEEILEDWKTQKCLPATK